MYSLKIRTPLIYLLFYSFITYILILSPKEKNITYDFITHLVKKELLYMSIKFTSYLLYIFVEHIIVFSHLVATS